MRTFYARFVWVVMLSALSAMPVYAQGSLLELSTAEELALEHDAVLKMRNAVSKAYYERSVSAETLPDPKVSLGLVNYPTDTFARDQEPMTQTRIAIQQMFPRGDTLALKSQLILQSSEINRAAALNQERMVRRQVRSVFLELFYWQQAESVVLKNQELFRKLVKITESQYASGIQRQQDVIRAELELDMLDDRLDMVRTRQEQAKAKLVKLIGDAENNQLISTTLPELPDVNFMADPIQQVEGHPRVKMEDGKVVRSQYGIKLAKQSYKPEWMFEVAYGMRDGANPDGSQRPDFASVMVSFDIPLFTNHKQDRQVAASQQRYQAATDARKETIRQLLSEFQQERASWLRLKTRLQRYHAIIVPQSKQNARAALLAYQSRRGDFTTLMRARVTELETELKESRLQTDLLKAQARLLYLLGES
ncbi:MAG: TolC family protein [Thioalkalispiraceae bacterium]|jgi:outer membrane protein TolC